jgi:serine/threonine-protein kinase
VCAAVTSTLSCRRRHGVHIGVFCAHIVARYRRGVMADTVDDADGVAIGTVLAGRYRVDGVLGTGGMARVYRGEHVAMAKPVAIKVLHTALEQNEEAVIRFQREAVASGRLDHPNIVTVMDFGVLDTGALYLVMEALDGESLGQRIARDKRLPWRDALRIIRGVLLGLGHAHERDVVHRDIKPDNIYLASKNGEEVVKVLDFGIAKVLGGGTGDNQGATRVGITVGTPTYMSPEQACGGEITAATDIYSTSVVLFEALVGRAPFESADPLTLLLSHAGNPVPTFAELAPRLDVPAELEALVRRGLTKSTAERIGASEYLAEIDELLGADEAVPARAPARAPTKPTPRSTPSVAPPRGPTASHPTAPQRGGWGKVMAMLVVLASGAAAAWFFYLRDFGQIAAASGSATAVVAASTTTDHDAQLAAALHDLQAGATCADRKKAVARLVELADGKAVPAIKKARAVGKANACLRDAADHAIKTLGGTASSS